MGVPFACGGDAQHNAAMTCFVVAKYARRLANEKAAAKRRNPVPLTAKRLGKGPANKRFMSSSPGTTGGQRMTTRRTAPAISEAGFHVESGRDRIHKVTNPD